MGAAIESRHPRWPAKPRRTFCPYTDHAPAPVLRHPSTPTHAPHRLQLRPPPHSRLQVSHDVGERGPLLGRLRRRAAERRVQRVGRKARAQDKNTEEPHLNQRAESAPGWLTEAHSYCHASLYPGPIRPASAPPPAPAPAPVPTATCAQHCDASRV